VSKCEKSFPLCRGVLIFPLSGPLLARTQVCPLQTPCLFWGFFFFFTSRPPPLPSRSAFDREKCRVLPNPRQRAGLIQSVPPPSFFRPPCFFPRSQQFGQSLRWVFFPVLSKRSGYPTEKVRFPDPFFTRRTRTLICSLFKPFPRSFFFPSHPQLRLSRMPSPLVDFGSIFFPTPTPLFALNVKEELPAWLEGAL